MKLLKLEVEGYRSLKNVVWKPGNLNVLIGPNGSGKTNLFKVLELLAMSADGKLTDFVRSEGGIVPMLWDGTAQPIRITVETTVPPPGPISEVFGVTPRREDKMIYHLQLDRVGSTGWYAIPHERLVFDPAAGAKGGEGQFRLLERDLMDGQILEAKSLDMVDATEYWRAEETLLSAAKAPFMLNTLISDYWRQVRSWTVYQPLGTGRDDPVRQSQIARFDEKLSPDGKNLVEFLHTLYDGKSDFKKEIDLAMRAAFGDAFARLAFPPASDQRIQLKIGWNHLERLQSGSDLSDGTLNFLFLVAVLAQPDPPPLIAVEEPEIGLHPAMLPIIAEYAVDASRRTQVIFSTHSPDFLDAFTTVAPTTTVFEWHDGRTVMRELSGDDLDYWLKEYGLGEVFRSGELEDLAKDSYAEEREMLE